MLAQASARFAKIAPRKARMIANLVRGRDAAEAIPHDCAIEYEGGGRVRLMLTRAFLERQGAPLYVERLDADRRRVVVGPREALRMRRIVLRFVERTISDPVDVAQHDAIHPQRFARADLSGRDVDGIVVLGGAEDARIWVQRDAHALNEAGERFTAGCPPLRIRGEISSAGMVSSSEPSTRSRSISFSSSRMLPGQA